MSVTVRGLAVRGTERPRGCARSGMPRAAASTTTSASRCSPLDATPAPTKYSVTTPFRTLFASHPCNYLVGGCLWEGGQGGEGEAGRLVLGISVGRLIEAKAKLERKCA